VRIVWPGPGRLTLAALAIVPAAMAYPWQTVTGKWLLGIAIALTLILFPWWDGQHLTTIVRRRLALLGARRGGGAHHLVDQSDADARTTAVLRVLPESDGDLPLEVIASYVDRYGLTLDAVRLTSRDNVVGRTTWVGLTMSAARNLDALQARSSRIPLRETAEVALRRLADHLRELGWHVTTVEADVPDLLGPEAKERWNAMEDGQQGHIAAYGVPVDDGLSDTLTALANLSAKEVWTTLTVTPGNRVSAACAVRTGETPGKSAPVAGLVSLKGRQRASLYAIAPDAVDVVSITEGPLSALADVCWPAVRTSVAQGTSSSAAGTPAD
jgi:type VII secretion protein EccE